MPCFSNNTDSVSVTPLRYPGVKLAWFHNYWTKEIEPGKKEWGQGERAGEEGKSWTQNTFDANLPWRADEARQECAVLDGGTLSVPAFL
jgi:hypothetical protein